METFVFYCPKCDKEVEFRGVLEDSRFELCPECKGSLEKKEAAPFCAVDFGGGKCSAETPSGGGCPT